MNKRCLPYMLLITAVMATHAFGQETVDAVESARKSLTDKKDFPWYDPETDKLERIDVSSPSDATAANRTSTWEGTARQQNTRTSNWSPNLSLGGVIWNLLTALAWAILLALVGFLAFLLIRTFLKSEAGQLSATGDHTPRETASDVDRVEQLPFQIKRPRSDLLGEARRNYEAGNYSEAVIYFFSYQLVQLDRNHWIRLMKGKTNRQYLREIRRAPTLHSMLEDTMVAFEDVFFGHYPIDRERFEECWKRLDDFHQNVEQAPV